MINSSISWFNFCLDFDDYFWLGMENCSSNVLGFWPGFFGGFADVLFLSLLVRILIWVLFLNVRFLITWFLTLWRLLRLHLLHLVRSTWIINDDFGGNLFVLVVLCLQVDDHFIGFLLIVDLLRCWIFNHDDLLLGLLEQMLLVELLVFLLFLLVFGGEESRNSVDVVVGVECHEEDDE